MRIVLTLFVFILSLVSGAKYAAVAITVSTTTTTTVAADTLFIQMLFRLYAHEKAQMVRNSFFNTKENTRFGFPFSQYRLFILTQEY